MKNKRLIALLLALCLVLGLCACGGEAVPADTTAPTTKPAPTVQVVEGLGTRYQHPSIDFESKSVKRC